MKKRNYVYDYEMSRKRRFLNAVSITVNYGIAILFAVFIFGGVAVAIANVIK